jgi:hypothetical protein
LPQRPPRGGGKLLRPQPVPLVVSGCIPGRLQENTGDLQWKIDADYNARPCDSERKAGGARTWETMKKQWKEQWKQSEIRAEDYVRLYGGELTGG